MILLVRHYEYIVKRFAEVTIIIFAGCLTCLLLFAGSPIFPINIFAAGNYSNCNEVRPGMTAQDVWRIMGRPDHTRTWGDQPEGLGYSYDRVNRLASDPTMTIYLKIPDYSPNIKYSETDYRVTGISCEDLG